MVKNLCGTKKVKAKNNELLFYFQYEINNTVCQNKLSLLMKIKWKQHHYLYTKIFYNTYIDVRKIFEGEEQGIN
jgi:hypothetical protein